MNIKVDNTGQTFAAEQATCDRAKTRSAEATKAKRESSDPDKLNSSGLTMQIDQNEMIRLVHEHGTDILTPAANSWWDDQKRLNPEICIGTVPSTVSVDGNHWRGLRCTYKGNPNGKGWVKWNPDKYEYEPCSPVSKLFPPSTN